jgi:MGT family glycosyltransferase
VTARGTGEDREGPGDPLPSSFGYLGAILDPDPGELPAEVAELVRGDDAPLVVTSLSTTYMHQESQLDAVVRALDGLRGVVTVGAGLEPDALGSRDRVLVRRWLPHERLLPYADVVVTHAGHGTVMAALAAGVPLVCMPMGRDQHGNSEQVVRLGAGVCIDPAADDEQLRSAIDEVLSDGRYRANAEQLAAGAKRLGGGARLAGEIESLIHDRSPATSVPTRRKGL